MKQQQYWCVFDDNTIWGVGKTQKEAIREAATYNYHINRDIIKKIKPTGEPIQGLFNVYPCSEDIFQKVRKQYPTKIKYVFKNNMVYTPQELPIHKISKFLYKVENMNRIKK